MDAPGLKTIFNEALERPDGSERAAYLDEACRGDAELRAQVEGLLNDHERIGRFLGTAAESVRSPAEAAGREPGDPRSVDITRADRPERGTVETSVPPGAASPGARIGPYKLIQPIGEGGMGTVWMAEQDRPVKRLVALKLIKAGLDSRQVIARFEAERQALALMDHPNIAKVLDAGATDGGRPYFVMELVKGIPITQFCDERRLTPRERLELAIPVCQAVQHAHQKGVIHRDIKPSNVLVALYDERPVPKVIDFGVAKATGPRLTEKTLYTEFGSIVGTLEYMSPEQAQLNQLDIDTRSDIYSLGVLLYELLTGTTPLQPKRLKEAAFLEMLRVIREEEPPRPSMRLSTTEELPSIAARRNVEPRRLSGLVRGDLDWVVMRCLEKDRARRYETASALGRDVQRYLSDEPVEARPPSAGYRARKFVRRNRGPVLAAALVLLTLLAGMVGTLAGLVEARRQRDSAEAVSRFLLDDVFARQERDVYGPEMTGPASLEQLLDRTTAAVTRAFPGDPAAAAAVQQAVGDLYYTVDLAKSEARLRAAHESRVRLSGADSPDAWKAAHRLAYTLAHRGLTGEALRLALPAEAGLRRTLGPDDPEALQASEALAAIFLALGRWDDGLSRLERVREVWRNLHGPDHVATLRSSFHLGEGYARAGRWADAVAVLEPLVQTRRRVSGPDASATVYAVDVLATAYENTGRLDAAEPLRRQSLAVREAQAPEQWTTAYARVLLGDLLSRRDRPDEAVPLLRDGYAGLRLRADQIPSDQRRDVLIAPLDRLIALAEAAGDAREGARWQAEKERQSRDLAPPSRPVAP